VCHPRQCQKGLNFHLLQVNCITVYDQTVFICVEILTFPCVVSVSK
jgi:hypothetical protein